MVSAPAPVAALDLGELQDQLVVQLELAGPRHYHSGIGIDRIAGTTTDCREAL